MSTGFEMQSVSEAMFTKQAELHICACALPCGGSLQGARARADHPAKLVAIPEKGHDMIRTPGEMRHCMQFWAQHLSRRPLPAAPGEEYVEVSTGQPG